MKLKPVIRKDLLKEKIEEHLEEVREEPKKEKRKKKPNSLPPDTYKPMTKPIRFLVRETVSMKDPTEKIRQYLELSVKRFGEDDENAPMVYIQMYQESERYTGYLKGKTVYLPLEMLYDLIDNLTDLSEDCDRNNIY